MNLPQVEMQKWQSFFPHAVVFIGTNAAFKVEKLPMDFLALKAGLVPMETTHALPQATSAGSQSCLSCLSCYFYHDTKTNCLRCWVTVIVEEDQIILG